MTTLVSIKSLKETKEVAGHSGAIYAVLELLNSLVVTGGEDSKIKILTTQISQIRKLFR